MTFFRGEYCIREICLPRLSESVIWVRFGNYLFLSFLCYKLLADVTVMHYPLKLKKCFSLGGKKNRSCINMPLSRHINIFGE